MTEAAAPARDPAEPVSPYERRTQTFPKLNDDRLKRAEAFGRRDRLEKGTVVFSRGERVVDFFIVLSGTIEIYDEDEDGEPNVFTVHGPSQFTGELDLFSSRKILVWGRMGEAGEVLRFDREQFRKLLIAEPDIGEIIVRAFILRRVGLIEETQGGVTLVGDRRSPDLLRIERFLRRNGYPRRVLEPGEERAREMLEELEAPDLPVVFCGTGEVLHAPSTLEVASCLGILEQIDHEEPYDVAVVGAGPSGLAAAVYAASEGLRAVVLESEAPGGQAGTSSKIENYLGFPTGISGQALAGRAQVQAQKFGATIAVPRRVVSVDCDRRPFCLTLDCGSTIGARSLVVASGARYRTLNLPNYERFEGGGIHYAATAMEADLCRGEEVIVVGGGNSAGQAAVFMARHAAHVHMLVRSDSLADSMSEYLIGRIDASPDITLHTRTEIIELHGEDRLEAVTWVKKAEDRHEKRDIRNVFVMIGAAPNTEWLNGCVMLDGCGFVRTGADCLDVWTLDRPPFILETSKPGVFAVGDVRSSSVKRVASAVGEGSIAVQFLHRVLDEADEEAEAA